jgi:uncharacterized protein (DUF1697 family)
VALVVLLRGVNVGGHRTFRPSVLAGQLAHLDVVNIGAAGTFVVRRAASQSKVRAEFASRLPFETDIMICRGSEILGLMKRHFARKPTGGATGFVTVLGKRPKRGASLPARLPVSGRWLVKVFARDDRYVVGVYRRDMKTIRYLGELDRQIGQRSTSRNWNTMHAIAAILSQPRRA